MRYHKIEKKVIERIMIF